MSAPERTSMSAPSIRSEKNEKNKENDKNDSARDEGDLIAELKRIDEERQYARLDAYLSALGIKRSLLTKSQADAKVKQLSDSQMPVEDIAPLIAYLLTDDWYRRQPERVTIRVITDRWPAWVANDKPTSIAPTPIRSFVDHRQAEADKLAADVAKIEQDKADDANAPYKGRFPSYWTKERIAAWQREHNCDYDDTINQVTISPADQVIDVIGVVR